MTDNGVFPKGPNKGREVNQAKISANRITGLEYCQLVGTATPLSEGLLDNPIQHVVVIKHHMSR